MKSGIISAWIVFYSLAMGQTRPALGQSAPTAVDKGAAQAKTRPTPAAAYRLPVRGIEIPAQARQALEQKLQAITAAAQPFAGDPLFAMWRCC